jgi:hypothetical protein
LDERDVRSLLIFVVLLTPLASADEMRDPTRPPVAAHHETGPSEPVPVLSAIMGSGSARVAIFNGHVVRSGGSVGTYVIQTVFEDGVRYRHAGMIHDLYLPRPATIKKPSTAAARSPAGDQ